MDIVMIYEDIFGMLWICDHICELVEVGLSSSRIDSRLLTPAESE